MAIGIFECSHTAGLIYLDQHITLEVPIGRTKRIGDRPYGLQEIQEDYREVVLPNERPSDDDTQLCYAPPPSSQGRLPNAVIETVAEAQLMDLGIFGGTNNGYQVVSKAFISQAGQCLMDVLGLDAGIALFNAIEGKVLDQQAFREALKKVVGKILDRTSKLVASGAVGAAIIITQWSYCMYKNRQAY